VVRTAVLLVYETSKIPGFAIAMLEGFT
jgi:hypothetical protein